MKSESEIRAKIVLLKDIELALRANGMADKGNCAIAINYLQWVLGERPRKEKIIRTTKIRLST